jgi:hypothetical protein
MNFDVDSFSRKNIIWNSWVKCFFTHVIVALAYSSCGKKMKKVLFYALVV